MKNSTHALNSILLVLYEFQRLGGCGKDNWDHIWSALRILPSMLYFCNASLLYEMVCHDLFEIINDVCYCTALSWVTINGFWKKSAEIFLWICYTDLGESRFFFLFTPGKCNTGSINLWQANTGYLTFSFPLLSLAVTSLLENKCWYSNAKKEPLTATSLGILLQSRHRGICWLWRPPFAHTSTCMITVASMTAPWWAWIYVKTSLTWIL